ncbi:MAG: hypothetical protein Faunusvirus23_8 [Faunusvirus sp.]|jgi:hypothetical protein|uniref:ParB/Sulfiredoxin domain-containing protein n=1 Tax=Faunusvirus sp. TaxID=2487766 RepID=A0A3G4ZZX8_9VIRU|nr:MAG: hypothetical protein Faunusvirus23_8 [Faunusvirus sp.]
MSNVKIHLPVYDADILAAFLKLGDSVKNIYYITIDKHTTYDTICRDIFDHPDKRIVILGNIKKQLPIPKHSKFLISELVNTARAASIDGYEKISKHKFIYFIANYLCNYTSHTFGYWVGNKVVYGDVFKLWYVSDKIKSQQVKTVDIIQKLYGGKDKDYIDVDIWGEGINVRTIKKHKYHQAAVKSANMDFPIILYKSGSNIQLIDGAHRLAKAYLEGIKTVKIKYVTGKHLDAVKIDNIKKYHKQFQIDKC